MALSEPKLDAAIDRVVTAITREFERNSRTCVECVCFNTPTEQCTKFKQRPPARVIAYGCVHFLREDDIPF